MGKIEEFVNGIQPLSQLIYNETVTYFACSDSVSLHAAPFYRGTWTIIFHTGGDGVVRLYFTVANRDLNFQNTDNPGCNNERIVFSGENVFRYLNIPYPDIQHNPGMDVTRLSLAILINFEKIKSAFSVKRIEKIYTSLKATTGNNQEEINRILPRLQWYD
jgi:hypothetical protein